MTRSHLQYIRLNLENSCTCNKLRGDQEFFVDTARDCSFTGFKTACDYWAITIDPDGEEPIDQLAKSGLNLRVGSGSRVNIDIKADAVTGAMFETMIDHEYNKLLTQDAADGLERTPTQRRLAALFALAERGYRRADGTHPAPLLNIVMSQKVAEWTQKQLVDPSKDPVPVDAFDIDGRCELVNGRPVHPLLVAAMTGLHKIDTPTLRRYVLDADSRILDYSYNARVAPEHLRTANHVEHRGQCAVTGCDAPHSWLQIDHTNPHSNGGPTSLPNTQPLCSPDNKTKGASTHHTA